MNQPPYLIKGDTVTIISTARKISQSETKPFVELLESWGLLVKYGSNLFNEYHQFSGTIEQRVSDLQEALNDADSKAVFCARGGYGTVQLIDEINFKKFQQHPKWVVGYSDVTVLHSHINQVFGIETLHATMPINVTKFSDKENVDKLYKALFGIELSFEFQLENGSSSFKGEITAPIVGGNLSILYSLNGSLSEINSKDKILFIEDLDEYLYHIDRMMMNLKRSKILKGCVAVFVGGMSDMNDNTIPFGNTAKEIILDNLKELDIPIIFGVPAGHTAKNLPLILNRPATLSVKNNKALLTFNGRS